MSAVEKESAVPDAFSEREALVLDSARAALTQDFQIAERLDAKARNQVAVGGAWFAVVQAVASIAIKEYFDSSRHDALFWLLLSLAIAFGVALAATIAFSYGVWKLRDEQDIGPEALGEMADAARDPDVDLLGMMVTHYRSVLARRRKNNRARATNLTRSTGAWMLALVLGLAELIAALVAISQA